MRQSVAAAVAARQRAKRAQLSSPQRVASEKRDVQDIPDDFDVDWCKSFAGRIQILSAVHSKSRAAGMEPAAIAGAAKDMYEEALLDDGKMEELWTMLVLERKQQTQDSRASHLQPHRAGSMGNLEVPEDDIPGPERADMMRRRLPVLKDALTWGFISLVQPKDWILVYDHCWNFKERELDNFRSVEEFKDHLYKVYDSALVMHVLLLSMFAGIFVDVFGFKYSGEPLWVGWDHLPSWTLAMGGILIGACTAGVYSLTMAIGTIPTISNQNFELFVRGPGRLLVMFPNYFIVLTGWGWIIWIVLIILMIGGTEHTPSWIVAGIFVALVGWTLSVGNSIMRIAMHAGMNKQRDLVPDEKTWVRSADHNELSLAMLHLAKENIKREKEERTRSARDAKDSVAARLASLNSQPEPQPQPEAAAARAALDSAARPVS